MPHVEYYYVDPADVVGERLSIRDSEFHHLVRVCRKEVGDSFCAVDGQGRWFECAIADIESRSVEAEILRERLNVGEPKFELTVAQAPPKGSRFDVVVEKGTEIGVHRFVPMQTERSVVPVGGKSERWRRIALAAMKQCGRSVWPEVTEAMLFKDVLRQFQGEGVRLVAHPGQTEPVPIRKQAGLRGGDAVRSGIVLIGPEGGFTDAEVQLAEGLGYIPVGLGPRRLRSETAGIVAATLLLACFEGLT